ncbi:50S ribosomal protein L24 [Candidatus Peribacteria bacterium RIFOXYC1_FULL_54_13]|nr:MAG: 50S ribosomal protein L24 [Candidatus Peribacteria bacterium RIFOXYC1_FULL_54_13]
MKIHTGDHVVVITGKDKGKTGAVLRVLSTTRRIIVAGINMRTKHVKATSQQPGRRLQYEASIAVSNVMVVDPKTRKRTRMGVRISEKGKKERIAKRSGEVVTHTVAKSTAHKQGAGAGEKAKAAKKGDVQKVEKPEKKPFWKKVSFGAGEAAEAGTDEMSDARKSGKDHAVPAQGKIPDLISHERGG